MLKAYKDIKKREQKKQEDAKQEDEPSATERKIVEYKELTDKAKELRIQIKSDEAALHLRTKEVIEGELDDGQAREVLRHKWILDLIDYLQRLPGSIIADRIARIETIAKRYATPMAAIEAEERAAAAELDSMLADLCCKSPNDQAAIDAIRKMLRE